MNIYIGNLSEDVTEDDLRKVFAEFGDLDSVKLITDKFSGESRGFGFVEMRSHEHVQRAIEELNESDLNGQSIVVNEARAREDFGGGRGDGRDRRGGGRGRPGGGGRGRGGGGGGRRY